MRRGDGRPPEVGERLRVDPAACDGVGVCAHLAPGTIELDRWGFPLVAERDLSRGEVAAARRAVRACPRQALWTEPSPDRVRAQAPAGAARDERPAPGIRT